MLAKPLENPLLGVTQEEGILPSGDTLQRLAAVILNLTFLVIAGTPALKNLCSYPTARFYHFAGLEFSLLPLG